MTKQLTLELNRKADIAWLRFCEINPKLVRFDVPLIKLNNRFTVVAGRCAVEENLIEMGNKFFPRFSREQFTVVLPHELAHQVDYNLNGLPKFNRWHGRTWSKIMIQYGLPADAYHTMDLKA